MICPKCNAKIFNRIDKIYIGCFNCGQHILSPEKTEIVNYRETKDVRQSVTEIKKEVKIMPSICKIEGCEKRAQKGKDKMCTLHFNEAAKAQKILNEEIQKRTKRAMTKLPEDTQNRQIQNENIIDLLEIFREYQRTEMAEFENKLAQFASQVEKMLFTIESIKQNI